VQDVAERHQGIVDATRDENERADRLCVLNVLEQAVHVCRTTIVQDAWRRGQALSVHGLIYSLQDGLLRDLGFTATAADEVPRQHGSAIGNLSASLAP
jgi:carbonic anhydrase